MGISRTVYEKEGDFRRKSQNFPHLLVFCVPAEGVPLELHIDAWIQRTRVVGLPVREKSLTMFFSRMDTMHQRDRQTDRQTDGL